MTKLAPIVASLALLSACSGPTGVWLFIFETPEVASGDADCAENLDMAQCRESDEPNSNGWSEDVSRDQSPGAGFGEIIDGPSGEAYLVMDGAVYVGTRESGMYNFVWENREDSSETQSHSSGYSYTETTDATSTTTISFARSGKSLTGSYSVNTVSERMWEETDVWNSGEGAPVSGQISNNPSYLLDTGISNSATETDCANDPCYVSETREADWSSTFTATLTSASDDAFDGIDGAGQEPGFDQ